MTWNNSIVCFGTLQAVSGRFAIGSTVRRWYEADCWICIACIRHSACFTILGTTLSTVYIGTTIYIWTSWIRASWKVFFYDNCNIGEVCSCFCCCFWWLIKNYLWTVGVISSTFECLWRTAQSWETLHITELTWNNIDVWVWNSFGSGPSHDHSN